MLVRREEPNTLQATFLEAYKETSPTFLALASTLAGPENLAIAVLGDTDGDKYRDAGHFTAPAALEADSVHEHIGIFAGN